VAREYAARGVAVDPERIVLTASSSESYGFLFKLLCDPGDAVLTPAPSYPLFAHLAALDGVRAVPFVLDPTDRWQPHRPEASDAAGACAAILVHPNNPTGSWVEPAAAEMLAGCTGSGKIPLIVDEVFLEYPLAPDADVRTFAARSAGLTFTLGGLSKSRGLPQLKLSWIVVSGPEAEAPRLSSRSRSSGTATSRWERPCRTRCPSCSYAQHRARRSSRAAVRTWSRRGDGGSDPQFRAARAGGWSAVLGFPRVIPEEALVMELLERHGAAVYPGYFFDFATEGYLVVSLLTAPAAFSLGFTLTLDAIASRL
jgi:aspartate/methionine/tyrosine aminotransferase